MVLLSMMIAMMRGDYRSSLVGPRMMWHRSLKNLSLVTKIREPSILNNRIPVPELKRTKLSRRKITKNLKMNLKFTLMPLAKRRRLAIMQS
jgi:hypothetical protein